METTKELKKQTTIQNILSRQDVRERFEKMLGKKAQGFITSVLQIVSQDEKLAAADPMSIYNVAVTAATLDLPLNNNLGFAYCIPYNTTLPNKTKKVMANFQMGYKGYIQLAQRTGQYKNISATPIYEGQLKTANPLTGYEFDFNAKKSNKVIGYAAYISLTTGFEKTMYSTKEEVHAHAKQYSPTYGKDWSAWKSAEDDMCMKTVLKELVSKYGPLSIETQRANEVDELVSEDIKSQTETFTDAEYVQPNNELEELKKKIESYNTVEELEVLKMSLDSNIYQQQIDEIGNKIEKINTENVKNKKK
ncbi:MAG: recombinase RecT [Nanoarchaeota archaeon]